MTNKNESIKQVIISKDKLEKLLNKKENKIALGDSNIVEVFKSLIKVKQ